MRLNWISLGYLAYAVEVVAAIAISILVVRGLSIEEFAAYKLAGAIVLVGSYLTSLGLDATLQRYGAELLARRQNAKMLQLLRAVRLARTTALAVFCVLLLVLREQLAQFFQFPQALTDALLLVCGMLVAHSTLNMNGYTLFSTRGEASESAIIKVIAAILRLVGIGIAFVATAGFAGILGAIMLSSSAALTYAWFKNRRWTRGLNLDPATVASGEAIEYRSRVMKYTIISYLAVNVAVFRDLAVDQFVISHYLGARDVAVYGLAATLITFATALNPASLLRGVVTPMIVSRYVSDGRGDSLEQAFQLLTKSVLVIYLPIAAYLLVMGREVIRLVYSSDYVDAYPSLAVLSALGIFAALAYPFAPLIAALEKNKLLLLSAITAIYNLGLDIVLVPRMGVVGAAWATGTAGIVQLGLFWVAFRAASGSVTLRFPYRALASTVTNLIPVVLMLLLCKAMVDSLLGLLLVSVLYVVAYLAAMYLRNAFSPSELALLRSSSARSGVLGR